MEESVDYQYKSAKQFCSVLRQTEKLIHPSMQHGLVRKLMFGRLTFGTALPLKNYRSASSAYHHPHQSMLQTVSGVCRFTASTALNMALMTDVLRFLKRLELIKIFPKDMEGFLDSDFGKIKRLFRQMSLMSTKNVSFLYQENYKCYTFERTRYNKLYTKYKTL